MIRYLISPASSLFVQIPSQDQKTHYQNSAFPTLCVRISLVDSHTKVQEYRTCFHFMTPPNVFQGWKEITLETIIAQQHIMNQITVNPITYCYLGAWQYHHCASLESEYIRISNNESLMETAAHNKNNWNWHLWHYGCRLCMITLNQITFPPGTYLHTWGHLITKILPDHF